MHTHCSKLPAFYCMESGNTANSKRKAEEDTDDTNRKAEKMPNAGRTPPTTRRMSSAGTESFLTESAFQRHMEGLEKRLCERMEKMGGELKQNKDDVQEVRQLLATTETNLLERMDDQKKQLESMVKSSVAAAVLNNPMPAYPAGRLTSKQEEAYWLHRRSLSVWPLVGEDVGAALKDFLMQKLRFTNDQIRDLGKITYKRLKEPVAKGRREVFCTFETKEARDTVKGASRHLASEGPGVGLRAQYPGFLLDTFRLFESIGYNLRAADETVRRAVKFDDSALDLMMDVKLNEEWKRIKPAEARAALQENPKLRRGPEEMTSKDLSNLVSRSLLRTPATGANATRMD